MWWQVSDGLLYNYFEDKEDLLASALLAHVGAVMSATPRLPEPGTGTVALRCQLASQNGRSLRRASTQPTHWQQRTAQAHRRLTKLGIPSRLTIDDFGHSTESGRR
jgi:AcrR family transcriptional regulator